MGEESYFLSSSRDKEFTFLGHRSKGRRRLAHISAFKTEVASHLLSIVEVQLQPIIIKLPYTLRNNWKLKTLYLTQHICTKLQNSQDSNLPISSRFHDY